jgi:hypothetical protein
LIVGSNPFAHDDFLVTLDEELLQEAKDRRVVFDAVFAAAVAPLAMFDSFAEVYHDADIEAVSVMDNRWQPLRSRYMG